MIFSANAIELGTDSSPKISRFKKASTICILLFFQNLLPESLLNKVGSPGSLSKRLDSPIPWNPLMQTAPKLLEISWRDITKIFRSLCYSQILALRLKLIRLALLWKSIRLKSIRIHPLEFKNWKSFQKRTIISSTGFWHLSTETSPHICSIHYLTRFKKKSYFVDFLLE